MLHIPASVFFIRKAGSMKQQNGLELNATGKKILSTVGRSRYDTEAINLIKDKQILAWILQDCVEEFKGMTREEIIPYIEEVSTGAVPVEPGLTNTVVLGEPSDLTESGSSEGAPSESGLSEGAPLDLSNTALVGDPTESKIPGEGVITYDIRFKARVPHSDHPGEKLLVNTELQNRENPADDIEPRADFYVGRMISEQMGQNVTGKDYSGLQRVYSIVVQRFVNPCALNIHLFRHGRVVVSRRCRRIASILRLAMTKNLDI